MFVNLVEQLVGYLQFAESGGLGPAGAKSRAEVEVSAGACRGARNQSDAEQAYRDSLSGLKRNC